MGSSNVSVTATFLGKKLPPVLVDAQGVWRVELPPQPATKQPTTIALSGSDGSMFLLKDVLFGEVYLCGGQSNMQYTPHSMAGMNNLTSELAAADAYGDTIRLFTVGTESVCGTPGSPSGRELPRSDCTKPWLQLNPNISVKAWSQNGMEQQFINGSWHSVPCGKGHACRQPWARASSEALGAQAWNTFSAVCWLTGRDIHDGLGGQVPVGLISSNWGGTPVESWLPESAAKSCNRNAHAGGLYNTMIAPFTVGPLSLTGFLWYQGESNIGPSDLAKNARDYACNFPAMIDGWRQEFRQRELWFGFVQIAGFSYAQVNKTTNTPDYHHSLAVGDLRQAQLSALKLPRVGFSTTIDTGDYTNIHPPDKQTPSRRLANQALVQIYNQSVAGAAFPFYAGSKHSTDGNQVTVTVAIRCGPSKSTLVQLTTEAPLAATQSTNLGTGVLLPRNKCVTAASFGHGVESFPQFCGYPTIEGSTLNGTKLVLNASAVIGSDRSSIVLTAEAPKGFKVSASSYGRATWPMTTFFSLHGLPVIPWYATLNASNAWTPPSQ